MKKQLRVLLAIFAAILLTGSTALAGDGDPATSNVLSSPTIVPYDRYLMLGSLPMAGAREVRFDLFDETLRDAGSHAVKL